MYLCSLVLPGPTQIREWIGRKFPAYKLKPMLAFLQLAGLVSGFLVWWVFKFFFGRPDFSGCMRIEWSQDFTDLLQNKFSIKTKQCYLLHRVN